MGGKTTSTTIPTLSPQQNQYLSAQTGMLTGTIIPAYQQGISSAQTQYNQSAPGVQNAAQNMAGVSGQAQNTLGQTGESALNTGVSGLENLFGSNYEANQVAAALQPAQAQYMQNLANQQAQFGGSGELGSARQALAGQQLAGMNEATQANTAATVENQIAQQRASAANQLAALGQNGLTGAQGAAQNVVNASEVPMAFNNSLLSAMYGAPSTSYGANFNGTQSTNTTGTNITSSGLGSLFSAMGL